MYYIIKNYIFSFFILLTITVAILTIQIPTNANAKNTFNCTKLLINFKKQLIHKKYAAFAKRRAFTITGMLGCGYSYNQKSQKAADRLALKLCRKVTRKPEKCYISHRTTK